ncbi:MAG: NAD(P)/FAD-dependent oxidoreductase [Chloroflexota bacterium]|nr:NAD(P)/FAD-dependent oxidoreductase [Chloroflexota bacterium]
MVSTHRNRLTSAAAVAALAGAGYGLARAVRSRARTDGRPRPLSDGQGHRIVIVGAGFGGLTTAIELGKLVGHDPSFEVTLLDRVNFHLFTPMLYQVATGLVEPGHIAYPVRTIAHRYGFTFREVNVTGIDLDRKQVVADDGEFPYDNLVLALGSTTNYFGNASIQEHAASLKTLRDAVHIRNRVVDAFERADVETDPEARRADLTFVVVGGGATGVELMGSLHTLIWQGLIHNYPGIDPAEVRLILCEGSPRLLNGFAPWMSETAAQHLRGKGVDVREGARVTEVSPEGIRLAGGDVIPARTVVWAAGVRPSPLMDGLDLPKGKDGRLIVDAHLRAKGRADVYVLGDCAWFPVDGQEDRPAPPNAQTAVREAAVVARNIVATCRGGPLERYEYKNEGNLVALGQGDGVAFVKGVRLDGMAAWMLWRGFYLSELLGFRNRLQVLTDWFSAYFVSRNTAKLDVGAGPSIAEVPAAINAGLSGSGLPRPDLPETRGRTSDGMPVSAQIPSAAPSEAPATTRVEPARPA